MPAELRPEAPWPEGFEATEDTDPTILDLARIAKEYNARFSTKTFINCWGRSIYSKLWVNDRWIVVRASDHPVGLTRHLTDRIFLYVGFDGLREDEARALRGQLQGMIEAPPRRSPMDLPQFRRRILEEVLEKLEDVPGKAARQKRAILRNWVSQVRRLERR